MTDARETMIDVIDGSLAALAGCLAVAVDGDARRAMAAIVVEAIEGAGLDVRFTSATMIREIVANTIITAPMLLKREDSVLETYADADEMEQLGDAVTALESRYRAPKDKRVQKLIRDAEAVRAAEAAPARTFTDPRLDPNYKPPKPPK